MTSEFSVAVHALVYLSHKAATVSSEVLAENICTNPTRVRKIMGRLKKAGLISTKEGLDGGYLISQKAGETTLQDVAEALEVTFVAASWHSGNPDMDCLVASGMADLMDQIYGELDWLCKERLKQITIAELEKKIFSNKKREKYETV